TRPPSRRAAGAEVSVSLDRSDADDEADARGPAAPDVERGEVPRSLHLVVPGGPGDLGVGVEELADTGRADGMARADETAARVDRMLAADLDPARLDRLPALTGLGDAEVIDRHVLARREAVVRLDAVDPVHVGD